MVTQADTANHEKLFEAIKGMSPEEQVALAERIALMTKKPDKEVASTVQAAIDNLQAASPAPVSPAAERLAELLKQPEPERSASTQIAEAQNIAKEAAAKGENVGAITQRIGADVGGAAFAQNVATQAVEQQKQAQQLDGQNNTKAMHEETVAKVEGREAPAAAPANPFAALLANADFKVPESMRQYNDSSSVTRIADTGQKRGAEGAHIA